jgi:hypothetical protein
MSGLIVLFWFVGGGVALRYFVCGCFLSCLCLDNLIQVLFIGVMSCMYALWDVVGKCHPLVESVHINFQCADDTITRKVNSSDASQFAKICGCFPSQGIVQHPSCEVELMATINSVGFHLAYRGYNLFRAWNYSWTSGVQGLTLFLFCKF